jgi:hypothetical protein
MNGRAILFLFASLVGSFCLAQAQEKPQRGARLLEMFQKLDTDGDGRLTREEGRSLTNFDAMDADHDGVLTPQEVAAFYAPKNVSPIPPSLLNRDAIENDKSPPFPSPDGFKPDDVPVGDPSVSYNSS